MIGPVALPMAGMVITSCVPEAPVTVASMPATVTVMSATLVGKLVPVMVTDVPGAPLVGVSPEIVGAGPPPPPPGTRVEELSHHCSAAGPQFISPKRSSDWQFAYPPRPGP
jgi:hypothetical protein